MKVLIVDDDKAMVKLLAASVEYCGHAALTANNGEQAVYAFELEQPDLVMMDIIMPIMDGIEAAERIFDLQSDARVVFVTGLGDYPEEIPEHIRRRASILTKPVGVPAILDLLETHVARVRSDLP